MSHNDSWDTGCIGDFFEPGRAYTTQTGYLAPELEWNFACTAVGGTPDGELIAFGFVQAGRPKWTPTGFGRQDFLDHAWNPARPPEWLTQADSPVPAPLSPVQQAEDFKRRRDLDGELSTLMRAGVELASAPWHPARPGDLVHVHYEQAGDFPAFGETYIVGAADGALLSMQLLAHTCPLMDDELTGSVGCFASEASDEPLHEAWYEAGPHRLTIVRDGRPVHVGGVR